MVTGPRRWPASVPRFPEAAVRLRYRSGNPEWSRTRPELGDPGTPSGHALPARVARRRGTNDGSQVLGHTAGPTRGIMRRIEEVAKFGHPHATPTGGATACARGKAGRRPVDAQPVGDLIELPKRARRRVARAPHGEAHACGNTDGSGPASGVRIGRTHVRPRRRHATSAGSSKRNLQRCMPRRGPSNDALTRFQRRVQRRAGQAPTGRPDRPQRPGRDRPRARPATPPLTGRTRSGSSPEPSTATTALTRPRGGR